MRLQPAAPKLEASTILLRASLEQRTSLHPALRALLDSLARGTLPVELGLVSTEVVQGADGCECSVLLLADSDAEVLGVLLTDTVDELSLLGARRVSLIAADDA